MINFVSDRQTENTSVSSAELALINGRVWTGNKSQPWAEALAARGEFITAVGSNDEIRRLVDDGTAVLDLEGRLAVPGFIDSHTHFMSGGFQLLSVDLRDAASPAEFARRIKEKAAQLGPGRWITGGNWDHEIWPDSPLPTKHWIDRDTTDNPVWVSRLDTHMALANSAALRVAGITHETADPPGGSIVRDAAGEPTGVVKDSAMSLVQRTVPERSDAECEGALNAALKEAATSGVTSIQDITSWRDYELFRRFRESNRLTVRVYARTPLADWKRQADAVAGRASGDRWLRLGGLKAFMDGSLGSTTALFFEPYDDAPCTCGLAVDDIPAGAVKKLAAEADRADLQCSIHAIGDKANGRLLDYFEEIERENGKRDRRPRIEHAQHLRAADIPRFGRLGVTASMQPYHAADDGRWAAKRIGAGRIKTTFAFRSLIDSGARVTFGSDWPVAPLSPILGIHAAVTRQTLDGKNPDGWVPEQKITVEEALRAYTIDAAWAEFAEKEKGSLEIGKLSDVVVLSQDIFQIKPDEIRKTEVVYTVAGGHVIHEQ